MNFIVNIYDRLAKRSKLLWASFAAFIILFVSLILNLNYSENISDFLPLGNSEQEALAVYQRISGAERIYMLFNNPQNEDMTIEAIDHFIGCVRELDSLNWCGDLTAQYDMSMMQELTDYIYSDIPYFLTSEDYERMDSLLSQTGYLDEQLHRDKQMLIMSSFLKSAANVYLQSDTFHEQYTALPMSESIANWQGTGSSFDFDTASSIKVEIKDPATPGQTKTISWGGILAVLFDYDACGVDCEEREVTSHVNAGARFTNYFYHQEARYWVDTNENAVVFFIGEATT
jgi:hypothetical protein